MMKELNTAEIRQVCGGTLHPALGPAISPLLFEAFLQSIAEYLDELNLAELLLPDHDPITVNS